MSLVCGYISKNMSYLEHQSMWYDQMTNKATVFFRNNVKKKYRKITSEKRCTKRFYCFAESFANLNIGIISSDKRFVLIATLPLVHVYPIWKRFPRSIVLGSIQDCNQSLKNYLLWHVKSWLLYWFWSILLDVIFSQWTIKFLFTILKDLRFRQLNVFHIY